MKIEQDDDAPRYEITQHSETRGFTDQQAKFVEQLTIGNTPTESARIAGYTYPAQNAHRLLQIPKIQREIRARATAILDVEGAMVGVGTLLSIAKNEKAPAAARVKAASSLLDRAGIGKKDTSKQVLSDMPIGEMNLEQLDAFISGGVAELARREAQKTSIDAVIIDGSAQTNPPGGTNT